MLSCLLERIFRRNEGDRDTAAAPGAKDQTVRNRRFHPLNEFAPIKDREAALGEDEEAGASATGRQPQPTHETEQTYVCREAVLDREQCVTGYEFMLRKGTRQRIRHAGPALLRLYDEVLIRNLVNMRIDRLLGHRLAFVGVMASTLQSELAEMLPPQGTVLIIRVMDDFPGGFDGLLGRIGELKKMGYRIAVDELADSPETDTLLELADFVMVDISVHDFHHIKTCVEIVTRKSMEARLIAKNVELFEEFDACKALPFRYFQGPFVTRREKWEQSRTDASQMRLLELLNLVRQDAEIVDMVQVFKQDAVLSFKLLRYINSPAGGLLTKVTSMEHALAVVGRKKLYRWLTLLIFSGGKSDEQGWALLENVLVRARLTETMARDRLSPTELDDLFVVGIFSLLDVLLRTPMEQVLAQLTLPDLVVAALLQRRGKYAPYLELAIACEEFDQKRIAQLAAACGLDEQRINICHVEALLWAQQVQA